MSDDVAADLRRTYAINEYYYPNISMDIDLPQGFEGEISNISRILEKNGFAVTSKNIFQIMSFKKSLITKYGGKVEEKVMTEYNDILREKEPVGSIVPPEYFLVSGLVAVFLFLLARFATSFADEAGKLLARKLFRKGEVRKQLLKELSINAREYNFFSNQIMVIINENDKSIEALRKGLKKKNKPE
jgi:hypothetical protein